MAFDEWIEQTIEKDVNDPFTTELMDLNAAKLIVDKLGDIIVDYCMTPVPVYNGKRYECVSRRMDSVHDFIDHFMNSDSKVILYGVRNINDIFDERTIIQFAEIIDEKNTENA